MTGIKRMATGVFLAAMLAGACAVAAFAQATPSQPKAQAAKPAADISKKVEVTMWMTGRSTPSDAELVLAELNKLALRDLNCTVNFNLFNSPDTQQKYVLLLSSGEPIDLLYSASYINYSANVEKGAFLPLDDLVQKYAPRLWEFVGKENWDATRVNGKIYMVPTTVKAYVPSGFMYREDLRVKYKLPKPVDLATIEAYLEGIKKNEPSIQPTGEVVTSVGAIGSYFTPWECLDLKYKWIDWRMPYGQYIDYFNPTKITSYWESQDFRDDMKMFKRWADKGFWSRSALANKETQVDAFRAGRIAATIGGNVNIESYATVEQALMTEHPDWKVGYLPYSRPKRLANPKHPTQDGFSITITSKNPERAIMLLEKLIMDKDYFELSQYGIKGKHFNVTKDGYWEVVGDISKVGFQREGLRLWATRNENYALYPKSYDTVKALFEECKTYSYPNIYTGFTEDATPYQAERAALFNVQSQYLTPIEAGLVDDVDAAIDAFVKRAKAAGLSKIHAEFSKAWNAYLRDKKFVK